MRRLVPLVVLLALASAAAADVAFAGHGVLHDWRGCNGGFLLAIAPSERYGELLAATWFVPDAGDPGCAFPVLGARVFRVTGTFAEGLVGDEVPLGGSAGTAVLETGPVAGGGPVPVRVTVAGVFKLEGFVRGFGA